MRAALWIAATFVISALLTAGCERTRQEERAQEKTDLPAINERIEREADDGNRPAPPATAPQRDADRQPAESGERR